LHNEIITLTELETELNHEILKRTFIEKGGSKEEHIKKHSKMEKDWKYDVFQNNVAVEIETVGTYYHSFLKFMLEYNISIVDVGALICPYKESGTRGHPMNVTERELKNLQNILPVPILLIDIPLKGKTSHPLSR
jgi:hypothetical protein